VVSGNGASSKSKPGVRAEHTLPGESEVLRELLVEEMQDLLSAEGQIVKALPKMIKAAESPALKAALQVHLEETQTHVQRLKEAFGILGVAARAKECKDMAGLLEEGAEMIREGKEKEPAAKEPAAKDLALIGAAQKVEHYEISAYNTARVMAQQLGQADIALLLGKTLAEEENANSVLTDCARPLMTEAKLVEAE
jgi:Mn-containing catalase